MVEVVEFKPFEPEAEVVKQLEHLLEEARKGGIRAICSTMVLDDKTTEWRSAGNIPVREMLGAMCRTMHQLNLLIDES